MESMVQNAANPKQIKKAKARERHQRSDELADIRAVVNLPEGRRFIWRLLGRANVFGSIWEPSAKIHYNAGEQDFGHFIMSEIGDASEEALFLMMKENKQNEREQNV